MVRQPSRLSVAVRSATRTSVTLPLRTLQVCSNDNTVDIHTGLLENNR